MENSGKTKKQRSRGYPAFNLQQSIEFANKVKISLGKGEHHRDAIGRALGVSGGTAIRRVAAMVHFGLMDVVRGRNGYYGLSKLAGSVLSPRDEGERVRALKEAARRPNIFGELWEKYKGTEIPSLLAHVLERDFSIIQKQAADCANVFRSSMEQAGLLRGDLLVEDFDEDSTDLSENQKRGGNHAIADVDSGSSKANRSGQAGDESKPPPPQRHRVFQILLDLERQATLSVPEPVALKDLDAVAEWIEFTKLRLEKKTPPSAATD